MTRTRTGKGSPAQSTGNNGRLVAGIVAAALLVVWAIFNRSQVDVSFVLWSAEIPLWMALAIAGLLGAAAGFLLGRRRYRRGPG